MTRRQGFIAAAAGMAALAVWLMVTGFGLFGLVALAVAAACAVPALRHG